MRAPYALSGLRGDATDSALPANRCSKHPKGYSDRGRIYRTYRPMNGQPMLPKWPNDGSSHIFGRNRESRTREAAGRRNWPEAVPRKMRGRKRLLTEIRQHHGQRQIRASEVRNYSYENTLQAV